MIENTIRAIRELRDSYNGVLRLTEEAPVAGLDTVAMETRDDLDAILASLKSIKQAGATEVETLKATSTAAAEDLCGQLLNLFYIIVPRSPSNCPCEFHAAEDKIREILPKLANEISPNVMKRYEDERMGRVKPE